MSRKIIISPSSLAPTTLLVKVSTVRLAGGPMLASWGGGVKLEAKSLFSWLENLAVEARREDSQFWDLAVPSVGIFLVPPPRTLCARLRTFFLSICGGCLGCCSEEALG